MLNVRPDEDESLFWRWSPSTSLVTSREGDMIPDELYWRLLRLLQDDPACSQRTLARALGISLGSTNHAVQALLERGWIKVQNFTHSDQKHRYLYLLTPDGLGEKARLAYRLLQRKRAEHQALLADIEQLRAEVQATPPGSFELGLPQES